MNPRHSLALAAATLAVAAGCGGSSGSSSGSSPSTPQAVIRVGSAAISTADSVGFTMKLGLTVHGATGATGPAAAVLQGPVSLELQGHSATRGSGKADIHFALNFTGGSVSGELLTPDGKTGYVQLPSLLGAGWHSFPLRAQGTSSGPTASPSSLLRGLRPVGWLRDLKLTKSGGTDTVSAAIDVPAMLHDVARLGAGQVPAAELGQVQSAVRVASGSISYSRDTHLPSAFDAQLKLVVPPKLAAGANGVRGLDLSVASTFSDWGKDFTVQRPAGATPLAGLRSMGAGLLGGG
jgi:hypothetical protein